jgi:hypothetical protein
VQAVTRVNAERAPSATLGTPVRLVPRSAEGDALAA